MATGRSWRSPDLTSRYLYAVILVFGFNALSAILFMVSVRRPVYDDPFNMFDVRAYAAHGFSVASIQAQRNPPGPMSFIWMATAVRLFGHDELLDARMAVLFGWFLLVVAMLACARYSQWPQLWYGALLAAMIFPHSLTATATVLTEGPALLFALLGVFAWTESASRPDGVSPESLAWVVVGGLSIGLAITCRQYYLALLPSAGILALLLLRGRPSQRIFQWLGSVFISLITALIPVLLLVLTWRGIASPGMETGASYGNYQIGVGLSWFRPVQVTFYAALYLVPYSFPAMWKVPLERRWPTVVAALLVGFVATYFRDSLMNPGPIHSLIAGASRIPAAAAALFWLITSVATYNAIGVCLLLWGERSRLRTCVPVVFALLVVSFFIAEQFGVGGNIPFYDRYILQLAPFFGLIGFWLFPRLTRSRILVVVGMAVFSHVMLWRYAFAR